MVTLLLVAAVAVALSGGPSAGPGRVAVQPAPAVAASGRPAAFIVPATDAPTTSTIVATTLAPTTAASTTPPKTTPKPVATTATPRVAPAAVARPVVAVPNTPAVVNDGGNPSDYTVIGYKWNPCQVISVSSSGPDISSIVSELASITGLHLQMASGTADITVQWGPVPAGGEIGITAWRAVNGLLSLAGINIGPQAQPYLATVLRHELGHALGLGHAAQPDEIMYPSAGRNSPTDYQAGDVAGLRAIGAAGRSC